MSETGSESMLPEDMETNEKNSESANGPGLNNTFLQLQPTQAYAEAATLPVADQLDGESKVTIIAYGEYRLNFEISPFHDTFCFNKL